MTFLSLPGDTRFSGELQNTAHTFAFGIAALISLKLLRSASQKNTHSALFQYLTVFVLCLIAGILVELLQLLTYSDADIYDVVRDAAGIVAFLAFYFYFDTSVTAKSAKNVTALRMLAIAVGATVMMAALLPLAGMSYAYYQRYHAYPVLLDFESGWFKNFIATCDSEIAVVAAPEQWANESGKSVAMVTLHQAQNPGLEFQEPQSDWTGYTHLNFKIYSMSPDPFRLTIRVHDKQHNQQYNDRYNHGINISQGENIVRIPLEDIQSAPAGRKMSMMEIAGIILFAAQLDKTANIFLSNIWLD
ncbi:MAG: VanZ family protein [Gammaproteobacteria bacterium]|nr:VanZ family protein [Gammaproteobacteria bacterium]